MMTQGDVLLLAILIALVLAGVGGRALRRFQGKRRQARGKKRERQAEALLRAAGYHILARQKTGRVRYWVDDRPKETVLHADYWVRKGRHFYIVEVKSGQQANPHLAAVRRQLLEYRAVFRPHGILFVDMEQKRVRQVAFEPTRTGLLPWLGGAAVGAGLMWLFIFIMG